MTLDVTVGPGDPATWPPLQKEEVHIARKVYGVVEIGVGCYPVVVVLEVNEEGQTDVDGIFDFHRLDENADISSFLTEPVIEYCERIARAQNGLKNPVTNNSWAEAGRAATLKAEFSAFFDRQG